MPIPCPRRAYCKINGCQGLCSDKRRIQTNDCPMNVTVKSATPLAQVKKKSQQPLTIHPTFQALMDQLLIPGEG